jgi:tetratricopeptide (TPR) repeat protein
LKALEKDVSRRYATVDAFAADLNAWLESRPVNAQKTSTWYVARKFAVRHRFGVIAGAIAAIGLMAALAFGGWQARQTQLEAAKTKRVLAFLQTLIAEASPNKTGVQTITVLDLLQRAPEVAKAQFPKDANLQFEVLRPVEKILRDLEAANALESVEAAMVRLLPSVSNVPISEDAELRTEYALTLAYLGKLDAADAVLNETLQQLKAAGQENSVASARVLMRQATVLWYRKKIANAANVATQAHTMLIANTGANDPLRTKYTYSLLEYLLNADRIAEAKIAEEAFFTDFAIKTFPTKKERLQFQVMKASLRWYLGDPHAGMLQYQGLLSEFKMFSGGQDVMYPQLLVLTARAALDAGLNTEATRALEEAITIEQGSSTPRIRSRIAHAVYMSIAQHRAGDHNAARKTLAIATQLIANAEAPTAYWQAVFQDTINGGDWARAEDALNKQAVRLNESEQVFEYAELQMDRAELLYRLGKTTEATKLARKAASSIQALAPVGHFRRVRAERTLSRIESR